MDEEVKIAAKNVKIGDKVRVQGDDLTYFFIRDIKEIGKNIELHFAYGLKANEPKDRLLTILKQS